MSANHRFVVRHVRFWRGAIQKWSTVYQFQGTPSGGSILDSDLTTIKGWDADMCYSKLITDGGTYQVECYDQTAGGPPVLTHNYFDPDSPSSWTGYGASAWGTFTQPTETTAEVSLGVRWLAGTSVTGKAVYMRKWYHSVPSSTAAAGAVDISPSVVTALTAAATSLQSSLVSRGMGLAPLGRTSVGPPVISAYYENHQMPRGRRRPIRVASAGEAFRGSTVITSRPVIAD